MREESRNMAVCSMTAALGVVVMLLGAVLELGVYLCPMVIGLGLIPIGRRYGLKYQLLLWIVISILSFLLVPNPEENLMFAGLFGWYPAVQPKLQKLPRVPRTVVKLLLFNGVALALESLVLLVLVPEAMDSAMAVLLLLLGNALFVLYDRVIDRFDVIVGNLKKRFRCKNSRFF